MMINVLQNKSIILMNNQNNQDDECFITDETLQLKTYSAAHEQDETNENIKYKLPEANQLKAYYRPTTLIARVMSSQPDIQALPQALNKPCLQISLPNTNVDTNTTKPKLNNKQKLGLSDYLGKKQFYLVYNKHGNLGPLSNASKKSISQMTIRLRAISQLSDYNQKLFKQIGQATNHRIMQDRIDSNFECGNLCRAYCNSNHERCYYLLLEQDTNTHGYTNWFFYRFRNLTKGLRRFFILNIVKKTVFYKQGMKISIFSMKKHKQSEQKVNWFKGGSNISFFQTNFTRQQHNDYFNCLYFQYDFEHEQDEVYFSVNQPYSYTRMANLISQMKCSRSCVQQLHQNSSIKSTSQQEFTAKKQLKTEWKVEIIGYTISNNIIPSVTFFVNNESQNKKTILFLGRQHPSEVAGSFICQKLIKILSNSHPSQELLFLINKFNIMIIPMINPDGVIYGNSRSNLAGLDLNRHWGADLIKQLTPQTHKIRTQLQNLQKNNNPIKLLLDLHGHGKKLNSFLFCCKKQDRVSNRYFPLIVSKFQERFELVSCTYGISRDKQNTIRAQLYDIGISDCYTLENSYYGYNVKMNRPTDQASTNNSEVICYNQFDYNEIAISIIKSLYIYFSNQKQEKQQAKLKFGFNMQTINQQLTKIVDKLQRQQKNTQNQQDIMSESDPEGDGLKLQQRLKLCNNKNLDKKIRQTFKKKTNQKSSNKIKKKVKTLQKNQKVRTQPPEQQKQSQQQDIKVLQKKIEGKLIMSKKLKVKHKVKITSRQRKSVMQVKRPIEQQSRLIKKLLNRSFNPFKIPSQQPNSIHPTKFIHSLYSVHSSTNNRTNNHIQKTKPYQKCKLFQKIRTEIQQNHSFSLSEIERQNERKQQIEKNLAKLKQQNLKNVVKQSLIFMDCAVKNKKCKFIEQKKNKNRLSNHLIDARLHSYSISMENQYEQSFPEQIIQSDNMKFKGQKSESNIQKSKLAYINSSQSVILKTCSQQKPARPKKSYQRFQAFVRNSPTLNKMMGENKKPVFYHFPVM